jgi:hypothetical protein
MESAKEEEAWGGIIGAEGCEPQGGEGREGGVEQGKGGGVDEESEESGCDDGETLDPRP